MTTRRKKILQIGGYAAFFVVLFAYFLYLGFPYDAIKNRVVEKIQEGTRFRIEILSFTPDLAAGFKLRDVRVYHGAATGHQMIAKIDKAHVRLGLLALLRGAARLSLNLDLYGGHLGGKVNGSGGKAGVEITFSDLDLGQYDLSPFLSTFGDFRLQGKLSGSLSLDYDAADLKAAKGSLDLRFQDLRLAGAQVYGMNIPPVVFQPAELKFELASKAIRVVSGDLKGDAMDVTLGGRMTLREDLSNSNLAYFLKFKPQGELDRKFGDVLAMVKKKDKDGYYRVNLSGTIAKPRFR